MPMSGYEITRTTDRYSETDTPSHHYSLTVDGDLAAEMWVDVATGEIGNIETRPQHRRHGYAAALYRHAAAEIQIFHAPESHRSIEGSAFAASVGGPTAPHDPACYCTPATDEEDELP